MASVDFDPVVADLVAKARGSGGQWEELENTSGVTVSRFSDGGASDMPVMRGSGMIAADLEQIFALVRPSTPRGPSVPCRG